MADATIDLNRLRVAQRNTELTSPDGTLPPDAPDWIWEVDNPYLHGPYAPIKTEMTGDESGRSRRAGGLTVVSSPKGCQVNVQSQILNQAVSSLP